MLNINTIKKTGFLFKRILNEMYSLQSKIFRGIFLAILMVVYCF